MPDSVFINYLVKSKGKTKTMQGGQNSNLASSMILEDHLSHVLSRTGPKPFKVSDNKFLPKPLHSAFGDFPNSHLPKKGGAVLQPAPLAAQEQSVANPNTQMGKS